MLLLALALACHKGPEPAPEPAAIEAKAAAPVCEGLPSALIEASTGSPGARLTLDDRGRVQVALTAGPEVVYPEGFEVEKSAMGQVQGWCPPELLCALAATPGVSRVRVPATADPK